MKIYKVHIYEHQEGSQGFEYFSSKMRAAERAATYNREEPDNRAATFELISFPNTKAGILKVLKDHGGHPDNG